MSRVISVPIVAAVYSAAPTLAWADADDRWYGHGMMSGAGGWLMGPLMIVIVLVLLVAAIVIALRLSGISGASRPTERSAIDILEERYARGEIDKAEFEERRRTLGEGTPGRSV
ncbi:MAG: SHOCT domain-containing protein [Alphaproteobacteria bacterium]